MNEDLQRIHDWVDSELVASELGLPEALHPADRENAIIGVVEGRAQYVVGIATEGLQERVSGLNLRESQLWAELLQTRSSIEIAKAALKSQGIDMASEQTIPWMILSPEGEEIRRLIEHGGAPSPEEVGRLFERLGEFRIDLSPSKDFNDRGLSEWLVHFKNQYDLPTGHHRGTVIKSIERAAKRFSQQHDRQFGEGNGFDFISRLAIPDEPIVVIEDSELDKRKIISSFTVKEPTKFLSEALKETGQHRFEKAGIKTLLGLRLIAEIQEQDRQLQSA